MFVDIKSLGLVRVGVVAPELKVADVKFNEEKIKAEMRKGEQKGCYFLVFPELCLTSYTCADLFFESTLRRSAEESIKSLTDFSRELKST
jgi:NAD+ synthase (glutamine-hydrolysing)